MIDYNRQLAIFNPAVHRVRLGTIGLIGVGAIGSAMALTLAKMGVEDFTIFDPDYVEVHNVPNQLLYSALDNGYLKTAVTVDAIEQLTTGTAKNIGKGIFARTRRATTADVSRYDTLIVATDSLASRAYFWSAAQKHPTHPYRYLDLRMGGLVAQCYAAERSNFRVHGEDIVATWPQRFVDYYTPLVDGTIPAEHDPCGAHSFLPVAMLAAAMGGMVIAAWGRGVTTAMGTTLSFECSQLPFSLVAELEE